MAVCSICKVSFSSLKCLGVHLKIIHSYNEKTSYNCGESHCFRSFATFKTYKQHFDKKHFSNNEHQINEIKNSIPNQINSATLNEVVSSNTNNICVEKDYLKSDIGELNSDLEDNTFIQFEELLKGNMLSIICDLYADSTFCRKDVQKILDLFKKLLCEPLKIFRSYLLSVLSSSFEITKFFDVLDLIFEEFKSEYLRFNVMKKSDLYIPPIPIVIREQKVQNKIL